MNALALSLDEMSPTRWRMASVRSSLLERSTCLQLISALLFWPLLVERVHTQNRSHEVRTLLTFREMNMAAVNLKFGSTGYWIDWNESDENPCAWAGVTCTDNYTVRELDLSGWGLGRFSNLSGSLFTVEVLSSLPDLRELDLSSNFLYAIPKDIGNLIGLTVLDISRSFVYGGIPRGISSCRGLRSLSLQENYLSGEILSLRGLENLQFLNLSRNHFSGPFAKELGELSSLVALDLSSNFLNGTIPSLPRLTHLVHLRLDHNNFTAFDEPWFLGTNRTLQHLSVSFNELEGWIPRSVVSLLNLRLLDMSNNRLSGDIPSGFSRQLETPHFQLDFSQNRLTGEIPADVLQQPSNLQTSTTPTSVTVEAIVKLSHNFLSGGITINGGNYFCFHILDLSYNKLGGPIPLNIFGTCGGAKNTLLLQNNLFYGDIVDVLLGSPFLNRTLELQLQNNLFTGDLSRLVNSSNLGGLFALDVSNNDLRWGTSTATPDPIKATLESLASLRWFLAGGNNFSGTSLPTSCFANQSLHKYGPYILRLDLSNSRLEGEISAELFNSSCLPHLEFLNLSNNEITGLVPQSIATLPYLATFDVSNNHLSGALPSIPFNSSLSNPSFFVGNPGLCGSPLQLCSSQRSGVQVWELLIIISGSLTIAIGSCLAATWKWRVYSKRHQQDADLIKTLMEKDAAVVMPLRELQKATNNFAKTAQIGEGGFGIVYKGNLNNGTIVAIKRSKREGSEEGKEQFLNEVRILSQVNHRNLVKLLGCCMENKIAALVFEFVSNGTLQDHLQGKVEAIRLNWHQRLKIGVQIADGLNYLHSATTFPIYHRDVKSANILLDGDLNAKVTDFGISRLDPMRDTHVSTRCVGTLGYMDPEYWASLQLTDKSDVYSFGVVLLELISGQPAIDFRRGEEDKSLVIYANPYIKNGDMEGLIDPSLMEMSNDPRGNWRDSILNVGRLAMKCVEMRSRARPSMNEVLKELQNFWLEFNGPSMQLGSIKEDDNEDQERDHIILLSKSFSSDSDSVGFTIQSDDNGIEMSPFAHPASFASFK